MDKKQILMSTLSLVVVLSLVYLYISFNSLVDDYNILVDDNRDLDEKYLNKFYEVQDLKVLIKDYKENLTKLNNKIDNQESQIEMLTTELKEKEREYDVLYEEYWRDNNFTWVKCSDSRTILKFCKGCDWNLECTGSMRPTFTCENTLYFCRAGKDEITVGSIIAFVSKEYTNENYETFYTIHRVVGITPEGKYLTKGDANLYIDEFIVPYKNIIGKLWRVDG